jgi:hypothetical protein
MPKPVKDSHYIDNQTFLKQIIQHKKEVRQAEKAGQPKPGVNDYIGKCFMDIAENLAKKPNFANYPFKEEMIGDAVENCIMYATNFNPAKSKNPFAFFTQIIFYAFLRRIQKEKKQLYIKMKQFEEFDPSGKFRNWLKDKFEPEQNPFSDILNLSQEEIAQFELRLKGKKKKVETTTKPKKKKVKKTSAKTTSSRLDNFIK